MIKKIIIIIFVFVGFIQISFADIYSNPKFSIIKNLVDNNISNDPYIFPDLENATKFCSSLGKNLLEYSSGSGAIEQKAFFDNSLSTWELSSNSYVDIISSIECVIPIDTTSTGTQILNELDFTNLYNSQSDIIELPTFSGAVLHLDYSNSLNDINKNLFEIKYILLIAFGFMLIFQFYFLINSLLGKK